MEFSARSIASLINGTVEGDDNAMVSTFAKIEEGHEGALSFLANPKYLHYIYDTKSTIVLVSKDFVPEHPVSATLIRVDDPYKSIAYLLDMVQKATDRMPEGIESPSFVAEGVEIPEGAYVGAFAYIAKGCTIGAGAKIFPQVYIGEYCTIGEGTIIYAGAKIYKGCKIGKNCIIHSGAVIGADGFGFAPLPDGTYSKIPQMGNVEIGNDVEIGANTTIDRAVMGSTKIEDGVKLDNLIQIAHNVSVGKSTVMAAQCGIAGSTKVGAHCMFAGQVGIVGHINIGDGTKIGAQSGLSHDTEPGSKIMGYPAVPGNEFARRQAYIRKLADLFSRVDKLEETIQKQ